MGVTEIVLLVLGMVIFVLSFIIPTKKEKLSKESLKEVKEEIQKIVDEAVREANSSIEDNVTEISDYNVEKAERAMERLCNEKILAINEYSGTVLESIDKNHKEVMFLYDMLNEKHNTLKETAGKVDKTLKEAKRTTKTAKETIKSSAKEEQDTSMPKEDTPKADVSKTDIPKTDTPKADVVKQLDLIKAGKKGKSSPAGKRTVKSKDEAPALNIGAAPDKNDGKRNSNEKILQLHKEGKSNVAIAKELGLGIGEVKLVIDLFEGI